ncbi:MAG TPA: hypothetical protein VIZ43_10895 [Trebonia sp.]
MKTSEQAAYDSGAHWGRFSAGEATATGFDPPKRIEAKDAAAQLKADYPARYADAAPTALECEQWLRGREDGRLAHIGLAAQHGRPADA